MAKKEKHLYHSTTIKHHSDGSHTVEHHASEGMPSKSYATPDLAGVQQGMEANLGAGPAAPSPASPMQGMQ
jgi:hypothetical protein